MRSILGIKIFSIPTCLARAITSSRSWSNSLA
ncbi:Uncharacterised protein [Vibrio cholerae]|nr:Uncharacterised protein [Vibrio cholerae]